MRLILGSQSPRRQEILSYFAIPFEQISPSFPEESIPFEGDPQAYVCALANGKADVIAPLYPHAAVMTADTIVFKDGKIYHKPKSKEEAFSALSDLSGKWHSVYTGVVIRKGGDVFSEEEETRVLFNKLTPEQIHQYHHVIDFTDKAGGYAIQRSGSLICNRIEGCYYNVMGLPINTVGNLLSQIGINVWEHLSS